MKIICNTARLNEACQNVQRAVSSKATMPAIEGILMKAEAGQVQLTGYDMDMASPPFRKPASKKTAPSS